MNWNRNYMAYYISLFQLKWFIPVQNQDLLGFWSISKNRRQLHDWVCRETVTISQPEKRLAWQYHWPTCRRGWPCVQRLTSRQVCERPGHLSLLWMELLPETLSEPAALQRLILRRLTPDLKIVVLPWSYRKWISVGQHCSIYYTTCSSLW